jgi:hypothetical protein
MNLSEVIEVSVPSRLVSALTGIPLTARPGELVVAGRIGGGPDYSLLKTLPVGYECVAAGTSFEAILAAFLLLSGQVR